MSAPPRLVMTPRNIARVGALTLLSLLGTGLTGGTAYAFWNAGGSGSGTAAATTTQVLTTSPATVSSGLLYPGATGDVRVTINNPNAFPVTVTAITGSTAITSNQGATCDASTGVTFTDQTGLSLTVPASSSATFTLVAAVAMDNGSDDSCQGATFTIPVDLAGASS